jgi:DNA-binding NarL/FixJ family response regulator
MKETAHANVIPAAQAALAGGTWVSPRLGARLAAKLSRRGAARSSGGAVADLTVRELEILELLKLGKTTKEIAAALHLSARTVDFHRANIKHKLELRSGAELIAFASSRL